MNVIAYRGLWDRFDGPGTLGAYYRSFLKGIPLLVDLEVASEDLKVHLLDWLTRFIKVPILFKDKTSAAIDSFQPESGRTNLFWIDTSSRCRGFLKIFRKYDRSWQLCGFYLPIANVDDAFDFAPESFAPKARFVVYESNDVLAGLEDMARNVTDIDRLERTLRIAFPTPMTIVRVSDLVEGLLLQQQLG